MNEYEDDHVALLQSCGPGEHCILYGDELLKLPVATIEAIHEAAFKAAYAAALELAGPSIEGQDVQFTVDDIAAGQTWMRVSITDATGRTTSAVGMIPDPRQH